MAITRADIKRALEAKRKAKAKGTWSGFDSLVGKLKRKGVRDPAALASVIGRRKFGKRNFQAMGVAGRRGLSRD